MKADDPRRRRLDEYLRQLRDELRLQAWDIVVGDREPDEEGATVAVKADSRRHWAPVFFNPEFFEQSLEDQRHDLTHELVHIILWDLWEFVDAGAWLHQLPSALFTQVKVDQREHIERATDFLARIIAPTMPMPPASWKSDTKP